MGYKSIFLVFVLFAIIFGVWFFYIPICNLFFLPSSSAPVESVCAAKANHLSANEIGDAYGSLNTLFSGLAFAGLIVTLFFQSRTLRFNQEELSLSREELKLMREEMEGQKLELSAQKEELRIQNETAKLQRFEMSFFNLLSMFQDVANSLKSNNINNIYESFYIDMGARNEGNISKIEKYEAAVKGERIAIIANSLQESKFVGSYNYSRLLFNIVRFIDEADLSGKKAEWVWETKYRYLGIIRSLLSQGELCLIFYNAFLFPRMPSLIEKYALLKDLNTQPTSYNRNILDMRNAWLTNGKGNIIAGPFNSRQEFEQHCISRSSLNRNEGSHKKFEFGPASMLVRDSDKYILYASSAFDKEIARENFLNNLKTTQMQ